MRIVEAAKPNFARHETFHPRYGWFRKAYTFVAEDPRIFIKEDAPVQIGVGKNMVRAIRFWGLAAKLIEVAPQFPNRRPPDLVPTPLGNTLFGDSGWDRYMEDPGTLWLLHWLLLAPLSRLPVWWLAFNEFHAVEFTDDDLEMVITTQLEAVAEWPKPHLSSVRKDISALLRTYAPTERSGSTGIDDLLDCPLRELNLIGRSSATGQYRFTLGVKPTLPSAILTYSVLDYITRTNTGGGNTITLSRLAYELGAPGKAFKLTEGEILTAIEPTVDETDALRLVSTTGASQLSWSRDPSEVATEVLNHYYGFPTSDIRVDQKSKQPTEAPLVGSQ